MNRALLAGAAAGLRASAGAAAVATSEPFRTLTRLGMAVELVIDKLPSTPSRLEPVGIGARIATSAFAGAVIARSVRKPALPSALAAVASALVAARVGHDVRVSHNSLVVAVVEDAIAVGLARLTRA
jgi:uncharacterized membrane protein